MFETMDPALQSAVMTLIQAILAVVAIILARYFVLLKAKVDMYLSEKIGAQKWDVFKDYAEQCIRTLRQSPAYELLEGEEKKQLAYGWLIGKARLLGLEVSAEDLDKLIEATYDAVKVAG